MNIFQVFEPGISIHAPRTGSDAHVGAGRPDCGISIHAPRTGSDWTSGRVSIKRYNISIHAPRTGSDRTTRQSQYIAAHFNPRSPHGERRYPQVARTLTAISIHAPRTGSDDLCASDGLLLHISIHAPRTGSDSRLRHSYPAGRHFNPRSPHGERLCALCIRTLTARFQSTLPARGATFAFTRRVEQTAQISIHAPRTGSDRRCCPPSCSMGCISIHAPRTGSDDIERQQNALRDIFQSTLPARGATGKPHKPEGILIIFQSTLPARGATELPATSSKVHTHFNPRSPHGERRGDDRALRIALLISIHAPRTGSDFTPMQLDARPHISIHAPRTGSDAVTREIIAKRKEISIHAPRTGSDGEIRRQPKR